MGDRYAADNLICQNLDAGEERSPLDKAMEAEIGEALCRTYAKAGVAWIVEAQGALGIVNINCPDLHRLGNVDYGVTLHIKNLPRYLDLKRAAVRAGGELLERAYVSRTTGVRSRQAVDRN